DPDRDHALETADRQPHAGPDPERAWHEFHAQPLLPDPGGRAGRRGGGRAAVVAAPRPLAPAAIPPLRVPGPRALLLPVLRGGEDRAGTHLGAAALDRRGADGRDLLGPAELSDSAGAVSHAVQLRGVYSDSRRVRRWRGSCVGGRAGPAGLPR